MSASAKHVRVALIWAMSRNRVIGNAGDLPWHLPLDLRHFQRTTRGAPVIMGRATFESVGARPLPRRTNIILTSLVDPPWDAGVLLARNIDEALAIGRREALRTDAARLFVAGGSAVYAAALPLADELIVTEIKAQVEGDTFFPEYDAEQWFCTERTAYPADEQHALAFDIALYERAGS